MNRKIMLKLGGAVVALYGTFKIGEVAGAAKLASKEIQLLIDYCKLEAKKDKGDDSDE